MKNIKAKWLTWLQFVAMLLFFLLEAHGKLLCGRLMTKKPKLPEHTRLASKQPKHDYVSLACETGYYFSKGRKNQDVPCKKFKSLCVHQIPKCKDEYPIPDARAGALNLRYRHGLDLIFVLDVSSGIKKVNFEIAREFVKTIVKTFGIDPRRDGDGTHIACVTYATRAQIEFTLNDYSVQTKAEALKRIDKIQYSRGVAATRLALDLVHKVIIPSGNRIKSKKALFLITHGDGESNVGGSPKKAARRLDKDDVEIYVIGIGTRVIDKSVRELATTTKNVFKIKDYKKLKKVRNMIVKKPVKDYSECGVSPFKPYDGTVRIVGGDKRDRRDWPWAVQVIIDGKHACGGTLINQEFVLTAAHCFKTKNQPIPDKFNVHVWFQNKNPKKRVLLTSLALYIHPDYDAEKYVNDIALIKIPKLKRFTRNQRRICLPRNVNDTRFIKDGKHMYVNKQPNEKDLSDDVKQVKLPFKNDKFCANNVKNKTAQGLRNWYFNPATQFCAGDLTGNNDTCQGDSGGPAMVLIKNVVTKKWRWTQIGIVSWGYGCAHQGKVGYYTRVTAFVEKWVDKITGSFQKKVNDT